MKLWQIVGMICLFIIGISILFVISVRGILLIVRDDTVDEIYAPLHAFTSLTVEPTEVLIGEEITIRNGVCNQSGRVVQAHYEIALLPVPARLGTETITLTEGELVLESGECEGEEFVDVVRRVPFGTYKLYARIETEKEGQLQEIERVSNEFTILDTRE